MGFIGGIAKLHRQLDELERKIAKSALRTALAKAGTPILKGARSEVPVLHGHLKKALAKKVWTNSKKSRAGVVIGVKDNYRVPNPGGDPANFIPKNYLHLVIMGTSAKATVDSKGRVFHHHATQPNDFLGRAQRATVAKARAILEADIKPAIKRAADRLT